MDKKFFVPYKTAQQLKEKGYPQEFAVGYYYKMVDEFVFVHSRYVPERVVKGQLTELGVLYTATPTYHEVLDWLEENGIYITTLWNIGETDKEDTYEIWWKCFVDITLHEEQVTSVYHTREEALNDGIIKALEML